ncbi:class D beta-lactamase [Ferirhizobium litorale]|uniref:class D beta-lactamase n=1 Tax=Ferirhizobium litorale TaxID=2927786 RepID=UPI00352FFE93
MTKSLAAACLLLLAAGSAHASGGQNYALECTIVADARTGEALHREGTCDQRFAPASTFKFALAVMGFDSGILKSPHDPVWKLKPEFHASKREQAYKTVDPAIWEKDSIVWYSQQLTMKLGMKRFSDYVTEFDYGNMDVSGDPGKANGLTRAWLMSSLAISPDEQIGFLHRFKTRSLPVSEQAYRQTEATIATFDADDGWKVHGKTGSGWLRDKNGKIDETRPLGWFVGWAEKDGREVIFARLNIGAEKSEKPGSIYAREKMLADLPRLVEAK